MNRYDITTIGSPIYDTDQTTERVSQGLNLNHPLRSHGYRSPGRKDALDSIMIVNWKSNGHGSACNSGRYLTNQRHYSYLLSSD